MIDLQECRKEIDVIDKEILRLFEKRMEVCEDVAEYKIHTGKQVLDPKREQDKLDVLKNQAHGSFNSLGAQELFQQIMAISRKRQYQLLTKNGIDMEKNYEMVDELPLKNVNVVFQGVEGAYSYAAMRAYFPDEINSYHVRTFRAAMEEVAFGKADYAVLPIENSTEGIVTDIYDLLTEYQLYIVGEQGVRVQHVLLGLPGVSVEEIDTVYSHPQALAQCKHYLEDHPSWKTVKTENTAASAKRVKEEQKRNQAAIASRAAGELYGLSVLAENICHNDQNVTRFIIVSSKPIYEKNNVEFEEVERLEDALPKLDILYMTRVQKERFFNEEDYVRMKDFYILDKQKMELAPKDMYILHPLPRVNEISVEVDDDPRAAYFRQAQYGVYVRMALILTLLEVEV